MVGVGDAGGAPAATGTDPGAAPAPGVRELFRSFMQVGLSGFGGVLPFARRMLVERRKWLDEKQFIEVLSLSQFLPGPNIVNVAIIVGRRFRGVPGAVAASLGLLGAPVAIVMMLAAVYAQFAGMPVVRGATHGVLAAAAGLIMSMGFRMSKQIRREGWKIAVAAVAFVAIGLFRIPLLWVLAVLAPVSILIAWRSAA